MYTVFEIYEFITLFIGKIPALIFCFSFMKKKNKISHIFSFHLRVRSITHLFSKAVSILIVTSGKKSMRIRVNLL